MIPCQSFDKPVTQNVSSVLKTVPPTHSLEQRLDLFSRARRFEVVMVVVVVAVASHEN